MSKKRCPCCNQYLPEIRPDGSRIIYGEGTAHLALTHAGRKAMMNAMLEEWRKELLIVTSYIIGQGVKGLLTADDKAYVAAHQLLAAAADDFPERIK